MLAGVILGLLVGFSLGLTGGGGSVFAIPLLVYALGVPAHEAVVISLAAVGATALGGGIVRWRDRQAEYRIALIFGLCGVVGAPLGVWLNPKFPEPVLLASFSVLMMVVALHMWRQATQRPEEIRILCNGLDPSVSTAPSCGYDASGRLQFTARCAVRLALTGAATGLLSGLFGVGGGFLIVPALVLIASLPIQRAVATSLWIIAIISTVGLLSHLMAGHPLRIAITLGFILGGMGGMALGIALGRRLAGPTLQKLFAGMIVTTAVLMLVRQVL